VRDLVRDEDVLKWIDERDIELPMCPRRDLAQASAQALRLLRTLNQAELHEGDDVYVDVIETASGSAMPLPERWFAGDRDSRWRIGADGYFAQVRGPARA
jgi:hypothetical protein